MVSDSNSDAWHQIMDGSVWSFPVQAIVGPEGCGKSHLAHIWQQKNGGQTSKATLLNDNIVKSFLNEKLPIVVEDLHTIIDEKFLPQQKCLLHLYNLAMENEGRILLTSCVPLGRMVFPLKDLHSRLTALPHVRAIAMPDQHLLSMVLKKSFIDRQITVDAAVISFLALRIERSFHAALGIVDAVDALSLQEKRKITIPLARRLLESLPA